MPAPAHNDFLWSHTRHDTFSRCLRRYYYAYYLAWGGWKPDAPPAVREAYLLKRLFTRSEWLARHVHSAVVALVRAALDMPSPPPPPALADALSAVETSRLDAMRAEFRDSRSGAFRTDPVHGVGLAEHEYRLPVPPEEWASLVALLGVALRRFADSPAAATLFSLPKTALLAADRPVLAVLEGGLKARAHPSLLYRRPDGALHLVLCEANPAVPPALSRTRAGVHAAIVAAAPGYLRHRFDPEAPVHATVCSPLLDHAETLAFTPADRQNALDWIRDSAEEMLFPLADPATNDPGDGSTFDPTPDTALCAACNFRRLCHPQEPAQ